jgi:hypothetical protein
MKPYTTKRKAIVFVLLFIILIFLWTILSIPYPFSLPSKSIDTIRIGVANLDYKNRKAFPLTKEIIDTNCDIFIALEWSGTNLDRALLKNSNYKISLNERRKGTHGVCVFAKNSLNIQSGLAESPIKGPCQIPIAIVRFTKENINFSLLGLHAPPPVKNCKNTTAPTLKAISDWIDDGVLQKKIDAGNVGDYIIVAGDFNTLPGNSSMKKFPLSGLKDAYKNTNWRPGPTWSPSFWIPSLVRIDYIFVPDRVKLVDCWTIRLPGSDHRGIVADIDITT